MAKTIGFGTVKGLLNANRPMIVVELNFQVRSRIDTISCGFVSPVTGVVVPLTSFQSAMVGVYKGQLDAETTQAPQVQAIDAWIEGGSPIVSDGPLPLSNPLWEHRWSLVGQDAAGVLVGFGAIDRHFTFGPKGLELEANQAYSVILPLPATENQPVPQNVADLIGILSVHGRQDEADDWPGKLR
jgi:hypothetical protein